MSLGDNFATRDAREGSRKRSKGGRERQWKRETNLVIDGLVSYVVSCWDER